MPSGRFEEADLLVEGETIAAVIRPGEEAPADAEPVDLEGKFVSPGFVDAHFHMLGFALKELRCDLSGVRSAREAADAMGGWAAENEGAGPVVGVDWDQSGWEEKAVPTRYMLDAAVPDRPAFARRVCCHVGVVNTAFLKLLGGHGRFVDAGTGFITEEAVDAATKLSYPPKAAIVGAVAAATGKLHRLGITTIHDIVEEQNFDAYVAGVRASPHVLRIDAFFHVHPENFDRVCRQADGVDENILRPVGVKVYTDGSLGGHTAALNSPYSDAHTIGEFLVEETDLARRLALCLEKGISIAVHAIGDRALRTVLVELLKFPADADVFRIEHAEVVGWDEMEMLKKAPVYLCLQPNFVRNWQGPGGLYEKRLGKTRLERCNPFRSFNDNGVEFAFGSDGMPPGPLYGLKGAVEHPTASQRLAAGEALRRYTGTAGTLGRFPRNAGRLEKGRLADLVVLSGDPTLEDPDRVRVERTYVGGRLVYREGGADGRRF